MATLTQVREHSKDYKWVAAEIEYLDSPWRVYSYVYHFITSRVNCDSYTDVTIIFSPRPSWQPYLRNHLTVRNKTLSNGFSSKLSLKREVSTWTFHAFTTFSGISRDIDNDRVIETRKRKIKRKAISCITKISLLQYMLIMGPLVTKILFARDKHA